MPPARRTRRPLLALVALLLLLTIGYAVQAAQSHRHGSPPTATASATVGARSAAGAVVALSALPPEARSTVALIQAGGPFPYPRDGVVFVNREGLLAHQRSGYYHEYTVTTPGESDRGPRRVIVGGGQNFYYTADHYASFRRIDLHR